MLVTDKFPPCGTELCEKPTRAPIVKKLPTFYGIQWFVSVFTGTHHFPHAQPDESSPWSPRAPVYLCKIHFNIISPPMLKYSPQSLSFRFPYQNFMFIYLLPHKSHMPHLSHPNNAGMDYKSTKDLITQFSPAISYYCPLRCKYSYDPVLQLCQSMLCPQYERPSFTAIKNKWHTILNWVLVIIPRIQSTLNFFMNASSQRHKGIKKKKHCSFKCNCWKFTIKGKY